MSCAGTGTKHQVFLHVHCFCTGGKTSVGHPDPKAQGREVSNMLLVCADGGVSAERNSVMHRYSGHFCTCGVSPYVSSEFSSLRGKRRLQESPQPVCHPGEAQTRKKSSITLVKEVKIPSNYSSKRGKARTGDPL